MRTVRVAFVLVAALGTMGLAGCETTEGDAYYASRTTYRSVPDEGYRRVIVEDDEVYAPAPVYVGRPRWDGPMYHRPRPEPQVWGPPRREPGWQPRPDRRPPFVDRPPPPPAVARPAPTFQPARPRGPAEAAPHGRRGPHGEWLAN
ncbi:hypothetical protein EYW49_11835 [Siculibacillus lacustris]|uniref:Uncharacterized protein n=1 Tax=Siculibacillus lacustris TaxID=1549641 RepID=A0A4Q9VND6_9HYPH|nr:hypothetical protein [Siculibacillus lacustris]TBW37155.1 hypothetical protein EYW49_11835 [Siculibacillus lacustris]